MNAEELRRLSEAATPGPWHHGLNEGWEYRYGSHIWRGSATEDPTDPEYDAQQFIAYTGRGVYTAEDAAFIVALVNLYRSNQLQVIERDRLARALHAAAGTHSRPRLTRQICPGPHMHEAEADAIIRALDSTTGDPE